MCNFGYADKFCIKNYVVFKNGRTVISNRRISSLCEKLIMKLLKLFFIYFLWKQHSWQIVSIKQNVEYLVLFYHQTVTETWDKYHLMRYLSHTYLEVHIRAFFLLCKWFFFQTLQSYSVTKNSVTKQFLMYFMLLILFQLLLILHFNFTPTHFTWMVKSNMCNHS